MYCSQFPKFYFRANKFLEQLFHANCSKTSPKGLNSLLKGTQPTKNSIFMASRHRAARCFIFTAKNVGKVIRRGRYKLFEKGKWRWRICFEGDTSGVYTRFPQGPGIDAERNESYYYRSMFPFLICNIYQLHRSGYTQCSGVRSMPLRQENRARPWKITEDKKRIGIQLLPPLCYGKCSFTQPEGWTFISIRRN